MFIKSISAKKASLLMLAGIIVIGALAASVYALAAGAATTPTLNKSSNTTDAATALSALNGFGWTVEQTPVEVSSVKIPTEFDAVYKKYETLQKDAGLSLVPYKGKVVTRYTYKVKNHPSGNQDTVRANVFLYNGKVVAGDVSTTALGGFMHALNSNTN